MINYTVHIDTLKIQIDFINKKEQREEMYNIARALHTTYPFLKVNYDKSIDSIKPLTHTVDTGGNKILELTSGAYKNKYKRTIYYVTVELAGMKQYNKYDKIAHDCLIRIAEYLNTNNIQFDFSGIDIAVDIESPFRFVYAFCNKRAAGVKYYKTYEQQYYSTTYYLERYNNTHKQVMKRSYLYYKPVKDEYISYPLTRFELKLQSSFFNKYPFRCGMLQRELDRYHILYFSTLGKKDDALTLYSQYENNPKRRSRDINKLGLDRYRLYPDTNEIEDFLTELYNVYEHELGLPIEEEDSSWIDKYL